jgi:hypothetical protein
VSIDLLRRAEVASDTLTADEIIELCIMLMWLAHWRRG